jgi:outer membrane protein assembly factor BamB
MAWQGFNRLLFWKKQAAPTRTERIQSIVQNLWNNHRVATIVGAASAIAIAGVVAGYLILKRPADKSCPDPCTIETTAGPKPIIGATDWPLYGLDPERTRYINAPNVKPPYSVKWQYKGNRLLEYSPVVHAGSLYAVNNNGLAFSVKTRSGKARWKHEVASQNASSPAWADDKIFISNLEPGQVQALDAHNGHRLWVRHLPGRTESSPVVVDGKVIAGCECGALYAFDENTGKPLWEADLPGQAKAAPAVSEGVAYIGDYSGTMTAVRIADGSTKWQTGSQGTSLGRAGAFYGTAAVAFGRVFAGSKDSRMYSFDKDTGDLEWSQSTDGELYAGVAVADTPNTVPTVYFGSYGGGTFYALDARNGHERWSIDAGGSVIGAASVIGETVYFANLHSTETTGVDAATGKEVFRFRDGAYNPVISDGNRLYLTGYKTLYALKPTQGQAVDGLVQKPKGAGKKKGKKGK